LTAARLSPRNRWLNLTVHPETVHAAFELYCYAEFARKVANDWTVQFAGKTYQLLPNHSFRPAKATVIVRHAFSACIRSLYRNQFIPYQPVKIPRRVSFKLWYDN
jgi:hypothetical protein